MSATKIEWVRGPGGESGFTVNPIRFRNLETGKVGHNCEKVSPGCAHCYAEAMNKGPYLSGLPFTAEAKSKGEFFFDDAVLEQVLRRRKPTGYFWCDMTDLFGSWVPSEWQDRCFATMALTPQHVHYVLTKRAERMREYLLSRQRSSKYWKVACPSGYTFDFTSLLDGKQYSLLPYPLPNVLLGVSVEDQQRADERLPELMKLAAMGWKTMVSAEPLLGPISFRWAKWDDGSPHPLREHQLPDVERGRRILAGSHGHLDGLRMLNTWVIVGGESGPGARPMHPDWARGIRDQCVAAGVPFFFKQWGAFVPYAGGSAHGGYLRHDGSLGTIQEWHNDQTVVAMECVGKKAAGRLLDGREWSEMPADTRGNSDDA